MSEPRRSKGAPPLYRLCQCSPWQLPYLANCTYKPRHGLIVSFEPCQEVLPSSSHFGPRCSTGRTLLAWLKLLYVRYKAERKGRLRAAASQTLLQIGAFRFLRGRKVNLSGRRSYWSLCVQEDKCHHSLKGCAQRCAHGEWR